VKLPLPLQLQRQFAVSRLLVGLSSRRRILHGHRERGDEGLALDPNSAICVWQSGMTLDRLGRFEESRVRFQRAVDLSRGGALMVSFLYRALIRLGRVAEARAILEAVRARAATEYIGESVWLAPALLDGDEDAIEAALRLNIEAETGPTTLSVSVDRELEALLPHPRLGPLVRRLSLYAQRPSPVAS
jgi:hypothetical protein